MFRLPCFPFWDGDTGIGRVCGLSAIAERRGSWSLRSFTSFRMTKHLERDDSKNGGVRGR
jgi:hypothetical protein